MRIEDMSGTTPATAFSTERVAGDASREPGAQDWRKYVVDPGLQTLIVTRLHSLISALRLWHRNE